MIIQCEQCQTKFKLDDSKVADKSIKVRCARCRHVFTVPPPPEEESASLWDQAPSVAEEQETETTGLESAVEFAPGTALPVSGAEETASLDTFDFGAAETQEEPAAQAAEEAGFSFPSVEASAPAAAEEEQGTDNLDFGAFDFGDASEESPAAAAVAEPQQSIPSPRKEVSGLDFSDDDMFGDVAAAPEEEEEALSFDMGMDDFADSIGTDVAPLDQNVSFAPQEKSAETPFSLDDLDFGDEMTSVAVQQVSPDELQPTKDVLFTPIAEPQFSAEAFEAAAPASPQPEEPAAPVSRLKEKPRLSGMLLMLWVMIVGLVIFYGVWGFKTLTGSKEEGTAISQDAGRISVRGVEATYVKNKKLGNLLVITGEAVNEYNNPRAAIQVKGLIFGANGEEVVSKTAFCGNPLTKEQLSTMSQEKIDAAMSNQFGDSLDNMEVAPGSAIPFVIVIPTPPAGATDYGVEPAGSTEASAKEKDK